MANISDRSIVYGNWGLNGREREKGEAHFDRPIWVND